MKRKYAYNLDDAGIIPADFTPSYISGSVGFGVYDDANPNLPAFKCWPVNDYEYAYEPDRILTEAIEAGYDTGLGYTLALTEKDRSQFVSMLVLLREANAPDDMMTEIADNTGTLHQLSVQALRQLLVNYGAYYQTLWAASRV